MTTLIIGHRGFVGSNLASLFPDASGAGRAEISQLSRRDCLRYLLRGPTSQKVVGQSKPLRKTDKRFKTCLLPVAV